MLLVLCEKEGPAQKAAPALPFRINAGFHLHLSREIYGYWRADAHLDRDDHHATNAKTLYDPSTGSDGNAVDRGGRGGQYTRAHTYKPFNEPLFFPSALVGSAADGLNATPIPVNRVSPAIHAATTFTLEVRGNSSFFPPSVTIAPGDTVVWLRVSGTHNVADDDGSFRLGEGAAGNPGSSWTKVSHTFNTAGTFRYFCEVHGGAGGIGISGTVIVQGTGVTPTSTPRATQTPTPTTTQPTTATATLLPTAISTTVPPGSNKLYLPLVTQS